MPADAIKCLETQCLQRDNRRTPGDHECACVYRESKGLVFVLAMQQLEGFAAAAMDNAGPKCKPGSISYSRAPKFESGSNPHTM